MASEIRTTAKKEGDRYDETKSAVSSALVPRINTTLSGVKWHLHISKAAVSKNKLRTDAIVNKDINIVDNGFLNRPYDKQT